MTRAVGPGGRRGVCRSGFVAILTLLTSSTAVGGSPYGPRAFAEEFCHERRPPGQTEHKCIMAQLEAMEIIRRSYGPNLIIDEGSEASRREDACVADASVGDLTDQVALLGCLRRVFGPR